jgi:hypothetical protein
MVLGRGAAAAVVGGLLIAGCGTSLPGSVVQSGATSSAIDAILASATPTSPTRSFVLDNVSLTVTTPFLSAVAFVAAAPGDTTQAASASLPNPYQELSITTVPPGTKAAAERALPVSAPGGAQASRDELHHVRSGQGATLAPRPAARLFGQTVLGELSIVKLPVHADGLWATAIVEWVTELGGRQWVVRAAQELSGDSLSQSTQVRTFTETLRTITVDASGAERPTTVGQDSPGADASVSGGGVFLAGRAVVNTSGIGSTAGGARLASANGVPMPPWWNGSQCDDAHHFATGGVHSAPIGPAFNGLVPCGPSQPDVDVAFGGGIALEFECVELSMRWLFQQFAQNPYPANGSQVVTNYPGHRLLKVSNGSGSAPAPGDVLSFGATTTWGHTAVVTDVHITDAAHGDGTVVVLAENAGGNGYASQQMTGWTIQAGIPITGWLHDPTDPQGYWLIGGDGGVFPYGFAVGWGSAYGHTGSPVVGVGTSTPDGRGYWMALKDGGIFPEGPTALGYGSAFGVVKEPVIGIASVPGGGGYYVFTAAGGVFPFGPRAYGFGSAWGAAATPIVAMAVAPDGMGYWLIASDGGVFPYGPSAKGYGSAYGHTSGSPIAGIAANPQAGGYWMVTANGGVFPFGPTASGFGSGFGRITAPIAGISATADGGGYWLVAQDGSVYPFGDARDYGGAKKVKLFSPIIGTASFG